MGSLAPASDRVEPEFLEFEGLVAALAEELKFVEDLKEEAVGLLQQNLFMTYLTFDFFG